LSLPRALLTDYAWPDLNIERRILGEADVELVVAEKTDFATLAALARDCDAILTNWVRVPVEVIEAAKRCQIICRLGIGLDNIDVAAATRLHIPVTNVPDYCLIEVAEHALALVFALGRKVAWYHDATKHGRYALQEGPTLRRIEGQTLGIVGLGNIGRKLAEKALGAGLQVIATSRSRRDVPSPVKIVELDDLLKRSDYISLHLPMTPETKHLISAARLAKMKRSAYLINTARGGLVDAQALATALRENCLAGAALDVQDPEPPDLSQPPYNDPRVIVTPHAAFVSQESLANLRERVARQVVDRLQGRRPENVVNPQVLERQ
jgi:D-3-phosphoglycerate dehydrogenase / 2-oxoglutarate reductase